MSSIILREKIHCVADYSTIAKYLVSDELRGHSGNQEFRAAYEDHFKKRPGANGHELEKEEAKKAEAKKYLCKTFGISLNSTIDDIRKAYRTWAKKNHPDRKVGDPEAFKTVSGYYEYFK